MPPKRLTRRKSAARTAAALSPDALAAPAEPSFGAAAPEPVAPTAEYDILDPTEPIALSPDREKDLRLQLQSDLTRLDGIFEKYRKECGLWRDLLDGNIEPKWLPFDDASKVFIPLPRVIKDAAHSRIWQTIFQQKEAAIVESPMKDSAAQNELSFSLNEGLKAAQRAINKLILDPSELNLPEKLDAVLDEITTTGTTHARVIHDKRVVPTKLRYDRSGAITKVDNYIECDQVRVDCIPVENCVWDFTADVGELRFFAYDYPIAKSEINMMAANQKWPSEKKTTVLRNPESQPSSWQQDEQTRERITPTADTTTVNVGAGYLLTEAYYRNFEIRPGIYADIAITYHKKTNTILRVILWPYIHNQMPVVTINYEQRRNRPNGRGTIEPIASLAAGVNAIANQTINGATVRDNPGMIAPEDSEAYRVLEAGWYPGIVVPERNKGEVRTFEFMASGNTQVHLALMDRLFSIAFQVSHLGPAQFGEVGESRRAAASLGLSIMQQGAELIDKIINRFRISVGKVILQALAIYWQVQPRKFKQIVGDTDAALIAKLFNEVGFDNLRVTLAMTSASYSKELDRQNYLAMIQTVLTYERQVLELVRGMEGGVDPKTGQPIPASPVFNAVAMAVLTDTQNLMSRWVESFPNITDASVIIPDAAGIVSDAQQAIQRIGAQLQQLQGRMQSGGMLPPGGGAPGGNPLAAPSALPSLGPGAIGPGAGAALPVPA